MSHLAVNDKSIDLQDFSLVRDFLNEISDFYFRNFTFRATFDTFFKGGVRNCLFPPANDDAFSVNIGDSKELMLCNIFTWLATKLAERYCVTFSRKKRPYEMLSLLLFNHYYNLKGQHFCDVGGASNPNVILGLFEASMHTIIESPGYQKIHGDIFARHDLDREAFREKLVSLKCNLEDLVFDREMKKIDRVYSMACFEHIMELDKALQSLYQNSNDGAYIYSVFYPIYSYFDNGHHGSVADEYRAKYPGIHHYQAGDQRLAIKDVHPEFSESEIMNELAKFNFNNVELINKFSYEEFRKIFYNSDFNFLSCQEINIALFQQSQKHGLAYKNMAAKRTAFPEVIGLRAVLKKGYASKNDCLISNSLLGFPVL